MSALEIWGLIHSYTCFRVLRSSSESAGQVYRAASLRVVSAPACTSVAVTIPLLVTKADLLEPEGGDLHPLLADGGPDQGRMHQFG